MLITIDKPVKVQRLYNIWKNMRQRCSNPNASGYKNYGGRGISICSDWDNFYVFQDWALSNGYEDNLEIDRIDSNSDYSPVNCRWVTKSFNSAMRNKDPRNRGFKRSRYSQEQVLLAKELRRSGHTYKHIGTVLGCGITHVKRIVDGELVYLGGR